MPLPTTAPTLSCASEAYSHLWEKREEEEEEKPLTSCLLEGIDGLVEAGQGGAVLPCSDLGVQCSEVEEDTSLLEGQSPLVGWDSCQGVVPGEGKSQQLPIPWSRSPVSLSWSIKSVLAHGKGVGTG